MTRGTTLAPSWIRGYQRSNLRPDLAAGLTIGAMLVPQGMAYALLAGLPPEIGLYASTLPLLAYALFGTSRQLAVGPVAIVSLLTASALAPLYEQGSVGYISAAALLALLVGVVHLVLGFGRLGFIVNFLSHSVLVGFTAAAAIIIGFSQVKHILGVSIPRTEHFHETVRELAAALGDTHPTTLAIGAGSGAPLLARYRRRPLLASLKRASNSSTCGASRPCAPVRGVRVSRDGRTTDQTPHSRLSVWDEREYGWIA